jgi:hypothetical protein
MVPEELLELRDDLSREQQRLGRLVRSLEELRSLLDQPDRRSQELIEAAALRLHSFYTAVERCLLLVSRVINGGTPSQGQGWHRRLLERMAMATEQRPGLLREETQIDLQAYLRFRHLVRNLYSDELRAEPIALLIRDLPAVWRKLSEDLDGFREWLATMAQGQDTAP